MIHVAHVSLFNGIGGIEQMLLHLCRHGDRTRFRYSISTVGEGPVTPEYRGLGVPVSTRSDQFEASFQAADLVNLHLGTWRYSAPSLPPVLRWGKPYVVTIHDHFVLPPLPTVAICTSRNAYERQPDKGRMVLIPNGVDLEPFQPRSRDECSRREVVITRVCRPPKCAPYFWDALHLVLRRYPQARLRIVGNPEPLPSSPQVEFLGVRRDIPQILSQSDLFVYTPYPGIGSRDLAVMEAAAAGLPCIVSDVPVVSEAIVDGVTGFLTPFGDVEALAARVGQMIEDHELRRRMGAAAARHAREQFDVRGVARRYEAVYQGVLGAWRGSPHG